MPAVLEFELSILPQIGQIVHSNLFDSDIGNW